MRLLPISLVGLILVFTVAPAGAVAGPSASDRVDVIVIFDDRVMESVITEAGGSVTGGESIDLLPVRFASVPSGAIETIEAHSAVVAADRDMELSSTDQTTPWGVEHIGASNISTTVNRSLQSNVTVAVIDTGVDYDHEDLDGSVAWGVNTVGTGSLRYGVTAADDDNGHGTHVAAIITANDNGVGVIGVAPNVTLYSAKVLDADGTGTGRDLIEGLDAAVAGPDNETGTSDDADVVSMSLGTSSGSTSLRLAIEAAAEHALLVAAAGNDGDGDVTTDDVQYPAKYDEVIAVAATNRSNGTPVWSSEGSAVELAAPGVGIHSTVIGGYGDKSGTSMATPHVAGTAALLIARARDDGTVRLNDSEIRWLMQDTASDIGTAGVDKRTGYGLIQADRAVTDSSFVPALASHLDRPIDLDDDGLLEDVTGNGEFDIGDVQALYTYHGTDAVQHNVDAFDFNDNDRIDIGDVQSLYVEYRNAL